MGALPVTLSSLSLGESNNLMKSAKLLQPLILSSIVDLFIKKRLNPDGKKVSKEKIVEKIKENFF